MPRKSSAVSTSAPRVEAGGSVAGELGTASDGRAVAADAGAAGVDGAADEAGLAVAGPPAPGNGDGRAAVTPVAVHAADNAVHATRIRTNVAHLTRTPRVSARFPQSPNPPSPAMLLQEISSPCPNHRWPHVAPAVWELHNAIS